MLVFWDRDDVFHWEHGNGAPRQNQGSTNREEVCVCVCVGVGVIVHTHACVCKYEL